MELTDEQRQTVHLRRSEDQLRAILALDDRPLDEAREPGRRIATNCRGFTVLAVTLLRHAGVPARARCGFGTYFNRGRFDGRDDPDRYGLTGMSETGYSWISGNVLRDAAALRDVEVLPWDCWGAMPGVEPDFEPFDRLAAATLAGDVGELMRNPRLSVPGTVLNFLRGAEEPLR